MQIRVRTERGAREVARTQEGRARRAVTRALGLAAVDIRDALRRQTVGAGLGRKLANAWRSQVYPRKGTSFRAAAEVWTKAPEIMESHARGATIRPKTSAYLAVPTAAAPRGRGGARMGPEDWPEQTYGPLAFVSRGRQAPLLVARGVRVTKAGRIRKATTRKATKTMGARTMLAGVASVPIFTLLKRVKLKRSIRVDQARQVGRSRIALYFQKLLRG